MAHRHISRRRSNSLAFGAKRTFSQPQLQNRIYEYAPFCNGPVALYLLSVFEENTADVLKRPLQLSHRQLFLTRPDAIPSAREINIVYHT
ncbi:MAG: hypothetical protein QOE78_1160 [Alphaproteobacteria bacterium]|jgi:hypothetical protein|nr:hypothetical protein [Alphaproteobacteria bacterium]